MKYYKLMYDYEHSDDYAMCDAAELHGMSNRCVDRGLPLSQEWKKPIFTFQLKTSQMLSDYQCNVKSWLMVSPKFIQATAEYIGDAVEFLPVALINRATGEEISGYSILNVINVVDALDLERADYSVYTIPGIDPYYSIRKYVLRADRIGSQHIVKLKGDTVPIFVSDDVRKTIKINRLTGFDFLPVTVS